MTDLRYELRHPKESFHNTSITMDCDQCVVATLHGKPMFTKVSQYFFLFTSSTYSGCCYLFLWLSLLCMTTSSIGSYNTILYVYYSYCLVYLCLTYSKICIKQVYTEGRLIVEFTFDDMMRIRSWHFAVRNHRELIPRNILAMQDPGMVESLSKNITRQGLTNTTLNYLRVIAIF